MSRGSSVTAPSSDDRRPLVQERGRLQPRRRDVHGLGRRRRGDFEGLVRRLDYLDSLGVDALWLAPFQPSPRRDDGYDISDYYGVDPRFGTSGDFVEFMHQADARGIRVLIDLVVNHTSDRHPWFRERARPDSSVRDWYVWSKKRPADCRSGVVFPGEQQSTWTYDREAREYYFHRFYDFQPDLNMDNPRVREEIRRIMGFWLQLGVAGFRVDAVPFVLEKPPRPERSASTSSTCKRVPRVPAVARGRRGAARRGERGAPGIAGRTSPTATGCT